MARIYTPARATFGKFLPGISDMTIDAEGVYKFMGCSVVSINMSLGFNSTASSISVTLIEDKAKGDRFISPAIPSMWAISLPRGGVGMPIFIDDVQLLQPDAFYPSTTPFYFAGICTNARADVRNISGKSIQVTLADPRELLSGTQCILSGFSLSREVGTGARYLNRKNIVDIFGYWDNGLESDRNEYGMPWYKILEVLNSVKVTLYDLNFEFVFQGPAFTDPPSWYRVDEQVIDIVSLCQRVSEDAGADFVVVGRKLSPVDMVVEIRAISRNSNNPITRTEMSRFIDARADIVESANIGREFKNEPTSSVVVGGMQNSNYLALPSSYVPEMHMTNFLEDYNKFPADIKKRIFSERITSPGAGIEDNLQYPVTTGSIFPFWGFTPDDNAVPLMEPFLPLDHLAFDRHSAKVADLSGRIPICLLETKFVKVRQVPHADVFIEDDGNSDSRPFAYIKHFAISPSNIHGYIRGLPLNTEVLRAALIGQEAFYSLYSLYYPDVAESLGFPRPDWEAIKDLLMNVSTSIKPDLRNVFIEEFLYRSNPSIDITNDLPRDNQGLVNKSVWGQISTEVKLMGILHRFRTIIYELVYQYALEHMGKRFIVALPRSAIMERIWNNLSVPTRPERPEIEYMVDDRGYWRDVPAEFDGIQNAQDTDENSVISNEEQIRRRFMAEDGRFYPMAVIDWRPTGNVNFNSNGINRAMFQDLPPSEFRPNRIAEGNPQYIFCACNISQLVKRPDLALVELPSAISFDPTVGISIFDQHKIPKMDDEFIAKKSGIMKYFWYLYSKDLNFKGMVNEIADLHGLEYGRYANEVFSTWANRLYRNKNEFYQSEFSTEIVMDLKGVVIPLTSNWRAYGPYYADYDQSHGMTRIEVDDSLVPWNFERPRGTRPWYDNLDTAGIERMTRTLSPVDYLDNATITVVGFPEVGPAQGVGYNSNLTGISIDFGIGGVRTTYNFSTYAARPGTYRKSEYDNVSRARIDTREKLPDTINENVVHSVFAPNERNRFL